MPQVWSWFLNACEHFGTGGSDKHGCNRQSWWCSNKWWGIREHCSLIFRWWDWKDERILLSFYEGKPRPFSSQRWYSIVNTFVTFEAWPFFTGLAKPWASAIFTTGGGDSSGRFWRKLWKRVRVDLTFLDPGQPPGRQRSLGKRCLDGDQTTFGIALRAFFLQILPTKIGLEFCVAKRLLSEGWSVDWGHEASKARTRQKRCDCGRAGRIAHDMTFIMSLNLCRCRWSWPSRHDTYHAVSLGCSLPKFDLGLCGHGEPQVLKDLIP